MALAVPPAKAKKIETGFLDRTVTVAGTEYKYQVFVPDNWTKKKKWPVVLFLHGAGERGDDGLIETEVGVGRAIRRDRSRFPAIEIGRARVGKECRSRWSPYHLKKKEESSVIH